MDEASDGSRARLVVEALGTSLLHNCNLSVGAGEVVALRGPSGSGKTLLLRAIADLDPNDGTVWFDGTARQAMTGPAWRRCVRYVAAEPAWWADRVGDHFANPEAGIASVAEFGLPGDCLQWRVERLSTGEKQRLGLARALLDSPPVLLLDEPTAALDDRAEQIVEAAIARRQSEGAAIVLVTHSDGQAARLASRSYSMAEGRLISAQP